MAWVVVPPLLEGRSQVDQRFPNREKGAEGTIGNLAHAGSASSHNPDKTGHPEFADGDAKDEVRAWDCDKDLRDTHGVTMEQLVQHWVTLARAGKMPWIRYIIFAGRIWHRKNNFETRTYTGSNKHNDHAHINAEFNQASDEMHNTDWQVLNFGLSGVPTTPVNLPTGGWAELKQGSKGAEVTKLQTFFVHTFPAYRSNVRFKRGQMLSVDGEFGEQTTAWVKEFQRRVGVAQDGKVGPNTLAQLKRFGFRP